MIIKEQFPISIYNNEERTLHIYVPDFLKEDDRCGVIYMYDGHNLFYDEDATYGKSWGLKDYFEKHKLPVIIVGLECNHIGNLRLCEFSPYSFKDKHWGEVKATGKELTQWIFHELKPYIDKKYPTIPNREFTALAGSSMGGLMAIYGGVEMSKYISRAICVSPYYNHIFTKLLKDCDKPIEENTEFYISWGSDECATKHSLAKYTEQNLVVAGKLQKQAKVYLHLYPKHRHCEADWQKETPTWLSELGISHWKRQKVKS